MNYIKISKNDIANGEGVGAVLWLSGCNHHCKNCHNPQTWDYNKGQSFDKNAENELMEHLKLPYISRLTLSGGDPLHENNLNDVLNLIDKIRILLPQKTIWLYSGYTWNQIFYPVITDDFNPNRYIKIKLRKEIVSKCDIFIDGRYIDELRDITLRWRGSSNQNIINVKERLKKENLLENI